MAVLPLDIIVCMTVIFLPLGQSTPKMSLTIHLTPCQPVHPVTPAFSTACLNERFTVYCVADNILGWRSEQVIGPVEISFQVGLDSPGSTASRRNATAMFINLNGNTINSSLSYTANNGVSIICVEDGSANDTYVQRISQRPEGVEFTIRDENSQHTLAWKKPANSDEYDFLNYTVTVKNIDNGKSEVMNRTSNSKSLNLEPDTNYLFTVTTVSRCDQGDVTSLNFSTGSTSSIITPSGFNDTTIALAIFGPLFIASVIVIIILSFFTSCCEKNCPLCFKCACCCCKKNCPFCFECCKKNCHSCFECCCPE